MNQKLINSCFNFIINSQEVERNLTEKLLGKIAESSRKNFPNSNHDVKKKYLQTLSCENS